MKVITIGRDSDNDVVISDSKVSRHHLQIVCEGAGFRVVDLDSTNGTFVNDRKIHSESPLMTGDSVRIGNTLLPWQSYFAKNGGERAKSKLYALWWGAGAAAAIVLAIVIFSLSNNYDKNTVKIHEKHGVRYIPVKLNGQELNFVFDTGASGICISMLEAVVLVKNGTLKKQDIIGNEPFMDASGNISVGLKFNLKTVEIGNKKLENVEATIIENPRAECLLGQTVLSRFGKYTIDNQKNEIVFE
ncbi:MAG: FHA domain-containing protein [Prevotellaceae bacterium]|jgi:aspartyl protease family protein|nr:FHA domain-containing protein [Prevotellaceae bacterium]